MRTLRLSRVRITDLVTAALASIIFIQRYLSDIRARTTKSKERTGEGQRTHLRRAQQIVVQSTNSCCFGGGDVTYDIYNGSAEAARRHESPLQSMTPILILYQHT